MSTSDSDAEPAPHSTPGSAAPSRASRMRKLLRGAGRFVDDIELPGLLHAAFVRSPVAHALLRGIDAARARALPGVRAVLTYRDLRPLLTCDRIPLALPVARHPIPRRSVLPRRATSSAYVGEPVALVVRREPRSRRGRGQRWSRSTRAAAGRARSRARGSPRDAPKARLDCPDNLVAHWMREVRRCRSAPSRAPRIGSPSVSASTRAAAIRSRRAAWWRATIRSRTCSRSGTRPRCRTRPSASWSRRSGWRSTRCA